MQAYVSHIEFDYKEYARQRFEQYWLRKPAILKGGGGDDTTPANSTRDV